ncbi:Response regulator protein VraR [Rhodobacteraceae bacterium THAF1]|uniref:LuxR C-terminal-related transcriptional regulator n=1 Tax=Palleronia sp. THAF1 TaxID=2587842 RepID=UPI000F3EF8DA|nr:response regulator transcription factor [Palleronia sp. THAF1]QFU10339.1 Response regulator protein VraR [Palleronia sp. THAF1]VDC31457.1 Response regulator protein VraR [Rhodobacteraceae bacterium THAF1]
MFKVGICSTSVFFRNAIKSLLGDQEVLEFETVHDARRAAAAYRCVQLIVHETDLLNEIDENAKFTEENIRIIVIAPKFSHSNLVSLIDRGIRGYQLETVSSSVLRATIQIVALNEIALPSVLAEHLAGIPKDVAYVPLSAKEMVVIRCLAKGYCNKEISRSVGIAEATTKVHVKAIMRKLGVSNRTQAAVWAVRHGFDQPKLNS